MTTHKAKNSWQSRAVLGVALALLTAAVLLVPRLTRGQEDKQVGLRPLPPGDVLDAYEVTDDAAPDFIGSPHVVNIGSFIASGVGSGDFVTNYFGYISSKAENVQRCYVAPVYLPDGATVTTMDTHFVDNTPYQLEVYLFRKPYAAGAPVSYSEMARVWSDPSGVPPSPNVVRWVDSTITNPVINNNTYHYYITACPWHPLHQIQSVRVFYTG